MSLAEVEPVDEALVEELLLEPVCSGVEDDVIESDESDVDAALGAEIFEVVDVVELGADDVPRDAAPVGELELEELGDERLVPKVTGLDKAEPVPVVSLAGAGELAVESVEEEPVSDPESLPQPGAASVGALPRSFSVSVAAGFSSVLDFLDFFDFFDGFSVLASGAGFADS
jgi:hypothetical protein